MTTITFNHDFTYANIDGTEHRIDWFDADENNRVNLVWLADGRSFARGDTTDDTDWRQISLSAQVDEINNLRAEIARLRAENERLQRHLGDQREQMLAEVERLREALEGVRTSVGQALDRIDRAPVPRTTGVNPVAREYLDQALAITREVLGDE